MDMPAILKKFPWLIVLLFFAILITILDLYTTYVLYRLGFVEANPLMYYIITNLGPWFFIVINFVLSMLLISFLTWGSIDKLEGKLIYVPLGIYCVIRGGAVMNNFLILMM